MLFVISGEQAGITVKMFLHSFLHCSRAQVTRLKTFDDGILLNDRPVTVRALLEEGDRLSLRFELRPEEQNEALLPPKTDEKEGEAASPQELSILYEDDAVLLLDKPPFMPTHPSRGHLQDTLANHLAEYYQRKGIPFRFHAVNRLDRDTSGIVLTAKTGLAAAILSGAMAQRRIGKEYIAFLSGILPSELSSGRIERNIRRREEGRIFRIPCDGSEGEYALTEYTVLARVECEDARESFTVVLARPRTGRTHQLRVHFASIGHPILGDTLYGQADLRIGRQALHAAKLVFPHPMTGETMEITAPLPEDMRRLWE